jgi:signal transduction histidine kinase/putative methionine-R-sulfoxide reductase with GAF domain/ActR/RegA family two-component response regulator
MSNEKKLHSRLERLLAGLGGVARDGEPRPVPVEPTDSVLAAAPGAPIDPHGVVPGWSWETDAQGRYTACSGEISALLGLEPAGLVGQPLTHVALPADSSGRRELASALQAQRPLLDLRLEARTPNGAERVVILNAMPLFDENDHFHGYRGVAHVVLEANELSALTRPAARPTPRAAASSAATTPAAPAAATSAPPARAPDPGPAAPAIQQSRPASPSVPRPPAPATDPNGRTLAPIAPAKPASWGYLADAQGLAPLGDWTAPEVDEALAKGLPVIRYAPADDANPSSGEAGSAARRALAVPIRLQNQTIGVLDFFDEGEVQGWSEDDLALVQAVSDQLALALENARLFDETRGYLNKQTLLYEVTRAAASATSLGDALDGAANALGHILPEADIAILLLDATGQTLHIRAAVGFPPDLADRLTVPVGAGITGWVAANNLAVLIRDVRQDPRYVAGVGGGISEAAVPLALGERVIGVLNVESPQAGAFDDSDLQLLSTLAGTLTAIIVNNNLLEEITRERERLSVLFDVLQGLITRPDRRAIYDTALGMAARLGAQHAYLLMIGKREADADFLSTLPGLDRLDARQSNAYALTIASQGLERWVLENGRPAIVPDTRADERWYMAPEHVREAPARAVISVPLQTQRGSLRGVLAYTHSMPGALGEEHLPLIESIARQVAVALENEQLRQQQREQSENAQSLARAAQAMTRTLVEAELHQIIVEQIFAAFEADGVILLRWIPGNNTFLPLAAQVAERESPEDRQAWPAPGQSFSATKRLDLLDSVENRRGRIVPVREEPDGRLRQSMALPLLYGDDVEGAVEVVRTGPIGGLGQADLELLQSILTAAASALQSARLYELQRQTAERLAEVDRLKSQFLANMSHELRTPLNSIIGFSRVILKGIDGPLTDLQSQDLASINNAGQHLLGLINDILDMARIEAGKMELVLDEVDLHDTINGVMSTTMALVKDKTVRLVQDVAPGLPRVRADSMRVRQVFLNLLSNAAKFTDSGTITLRARPMEAVGPYSGRLEPFVEISVIDTGTGIARGDMPKLFEPFSQVDASATRKAGGTGLGLSICRQLVELHSGRIWAESELGKGSTFTFILPVGQLEGAPPQPQEAAPNAGDPQRVVLAVEDDPGLVGLYRRFLEPHGYRVVGVNRSSEAIARAAELRPIVVLLDVLMPNKDGWQVLTELKRSELTRDIPVIMCTLITEPERALEMGAADYLVKPILEADLLGALRRLPAAVPANGRGSEQPAPEDRAG